MTKSERRDCGGSALALALALALGVDATVSGSTPLKWRSLGSHPFRPSRPIMVL